MMRNDEKCIKMHRNEETHRLGAVPTGMAIALHILYIIPTLQIVAFLPFHSSWRDREASERSLILGLSNLVETFFTFASHGLLSYLLVPLIQDCVVLQLALLFSFVLQNSTENHKTYQDITKQLRG